MGMATLAVKYTVVVRLVVEGTASLVAEGMVTLVVGVRGKATPAVVGVVVVHTQAGEPHTKIRPEMAATA